MLRRVPTGGLHSDRCRWALGQILGVDSGVRLGIMDSTTESLLKGYMKSRLILSMG